MKKKNEIVNGFIQTYGLEFFAVDHCNLKCYGCSQCSPFLEKHFADLSVFEKSLQVLRKYLRPNKITILGGEPLLHPEIDSLISIAISAKMFNKVHITTNGFNLLKMSSNFWSQVDVLRISKYPINTDFVNNNLSNLKDKCRANNVELQIREMNSFNHIILSEKNTIKDVVEQIYHKCIYKYYCHTLSNDKIFRCSPIVNLEKYQSAIHSSFQYNPNDYLRIEDSFNFKENLHSYLNSDNSLSGCQFCLGSSGKPFSHKQLTKDEILNPVKNSLSIENYDNHG
jgi:organic radical activating enzyme